MTESESYINGSEKIFTFALWYFRFALHNVVNLLSTFCFWPSWERGPWFVVTTRSSNVCLFHASSVRCYSAAWWENDKVGTHCKAAQQKKLRPLRSPLQSCFFLSLADFCASVVGSEVEKKCVTLKILVALLICSVAETLKMLTNEQQVVSARCFHSVMVLNSFILCVYWTSNLALSHRRLKTGMQINCQDISVTLRPNSWDLWMLLLPKCFYCFT